MTFKVYLKWPWPNLKSLSDMNSSVSPSWRCLCLCLLWIWLLFFHPEIFVILFVLLFTQTFSRVFPWGMARTFLFSQTATPDNFWILSGVQFRSESSFRINFSSTHFCLLISHPPNFSTFSCPTLHHSPHPRHRSYLRPLCPPHPSPAFDSSASREKGRKRKSKESQQALLCSIFFSSTPSFLQCVRERWMQPVELIAPRYWRSASLHCWRADLPYGCPLGEHFD